MECPDFGRTKTRSGIRINKAIDHSNQYKDIATSEGRTECRSRLPALPPIPAFAALTGAVRVGARSDRGTFLDSTTPLVHVEQGMPPELLTPGPRSSSTLSLVTILQGGIVMRRMAAIVFAFFALLAAAPAHAS